LWGIRRTDRAATDVTTPRRTGRSRKGINVHRPGRLTDADITVVMLRLAALIARAPPARSCSGSAMSVREDRLLPP
jgi:hypothetical protein